MSMVWDSNIQTSQKMALLAMCDWADDEGGSVYPSIAKLAKRISCSERQAQRIVHGLIDDGLVAVVGNALGGVPGQSRQYRINVKRLFALSLGASVAQLQPTPASEGRGDILSPVEMEEKQEGGVTPTTPTGDMGVTLSPMYPSFNTPLPPDGGASGFEEFWTAYPKKAAEAKAQRLWNKLAPDVALRRVIVDAVRVQSAGANWTKDGGQFVPMPSTWLRDKRWLDTVAGVAGAEPALVEGSRAHVEQTAVRMGFKAWDGLEQFPVYKAQVMSAAGQSPSARA
jgi:hypothetical protein